MSRKLPAINPYLRDPAMRERMVVKSSVATSSAIEGIRVPFRRTTNGSGKADGTPPRGTASKSRATRA
jgi:hypothetical protein